MNGRKKEKKEGRKAISAFNIIRVDLLTKRLQSLRGCLYLLLCRLITFSRTTMQIYLLLLPSLLQPRSWTPPLSWSPLHSNPHIRAGTGKLNSSDTYLHREVFFLLLLRKFSFYCPTRLSLHQTVTFLVYFSSSGAAHKKQDDNFVLSEEPGEVLGWL